MNPYNGLRRTPMSTFDPDELPPAYDDRAPLAVKTPDPVVQRRNRGNKQRGKTAERLWTALINERSPNLAVKSGVLGGADVLTPLWAFEVKHRHMYWPSNTTIKRALVQAANNAGTRTPVVVACMTTHNSREWRVYSAVGVYEDGNEVLMDVLAGLAIGEWTYADFAVYHASPPCQSYSRQLKHRATPKPRLIAYLRELLTFETYVIENVRGAELNGPIMCGSALGMNVWRHRIFESNVALLVPPCQHDRIPLNPYNTVSKRRDGISGTSDPRFKEAMGVDWMTGAEASESIPPAYTEYIGKQLMAVLL